MIMNKETGEPNIKSVFIGLTKRVASINDIIQRLEDSGLEGLVPGWIDCIPHDAVNWKSETPKPVREITNL